MGARCVTMPRLPRITASSCAAAKGRSKSKSPPSSTHAPAGWGGRAPALRASVDVIMLKRIAAIYFSLALATWAHAQDADPAEAAAPLTSRAVMTSEQVVQILDETVD